jgi:hypothetical protein
MPLHQSRSVSRVMWNDLHAKCIRGAAGRNAQPFVGAQWELWRALARTDQRLRSYDASEHAHIDRRFPRGDLPSGCFSNQNWQQPVRTARWAGPGQAPYPGRLERAGSPSVSRSPERGSPSPPRSEPSTRGSFRKRAGLANLRSPSGQNARLRGWIEKETEGVTPVSTRHRPGNSHCAPTAVFITGTPAAQPDESTTP